MVKITKVYTRTGDDGTTGLVGGARVPKDAPRVHAYGEIDELNCILGLARTAGASRGPARVPQMLEQLQNELFDLGAELATAPSAPGAPEPSTARMIGKEHWERLESWIDELTANVPELRSFVLPGGTNLNAHLHLARAVARRAERTVLSLSRQETVSRDLLIYLNRLSDLLFAMARAASAAEGAPEYLWVPGEKRPVPASERPS